MPKKSKHERGKCEDEKHLSDERRKKYASIGEKPNDLKIKKKKLKHKSQLKRHKSRRRSTDSSSCTSSSSDESRHGRKKKKSKIPKTRNDYSSDDWVEKTTVYNDKIENSSNINRDGLVRDGWMTTGSFVLPTFSREHKEPIKPNAKAQQIDAYDPATSKCELNPYWKSNGSGLPAFQKPKPDDDCDNTARATRSLHETNTTGARNWRKKSSQTSLNDPKKSPASKTVSLLDDQRGTISIDYLTDEQINDLAARAIKAELKGKMELMAELNQQLEDARRRRSAAQDKGDLLSEQSSSRHLLLTHTDQKGNVRPLMQGLSTNETKSNKEQHGNKKKVLNTHEAGQRVRYFADDDCYDIKKMFQCEKYATAAESNLQFANIFSKNKNSNDDLDIFTDNVRRNISKADSATRQMQLSINKEEKFLSTLDNCEFCVDSLKQNKELRVSMGNKIYLSMPWYKGLQNGHCILSSIQHVPCCTQLDEDAWEELNNFRRGLTAMFAAQSKEVIFYEIANKLHRRPHFALHCIPIPNSYGEMAPFYFKKAIEESEQEWCINKQLISLQKKSLRAVVPKELPYVWINFGMDMGFAHVIEDQERFRPNFAQEIIGGMLELNSNNWRKQSKEHNTSSKVAAFKELWKKYCPIH